MKHIQRLGFSSLVFALIACGSTEIDSQQALQSASPPVEAAVTILLDQSVAAEAASGAVADRVAASEDAESAAADAVNTAEDADTAQDFSAAAEALVAAGRSGLDAINTAAIDADSAINATLDATRSLNEAVQGATAANDVDALTIAADEVEALANDAMPEVAGDMETAVDLAEKIATHATDAAEMADAMELPAVAETLRALSAESTLVAEAAGTRVAPAEAAGDAAKAAADAAYSAADQLED